MKQNDISKKVSSIVENYPAKVFKNRKSHIITKETNMEDNVITANTRTVPGIMTNRGCCYAGCKGVVLGPIRDAVVLTHGPIGCGYYTWGTRRNKGRTDGDEKNLIHYSFSTDLQESDIVFGGEKKLRQAVKEAIEIFDPKALFICSTCPVGLIGDDINAVAKEAEEKYGITVIAFSCEGYKGVSQSGGHHIANNGLIKNVIGKGKKEFGKYSVNVLGEYNIGGDGWEVERLLKIIGYEVVSVMTGNGTVRDMENAHKATLNVIQCHRSINYIGEMMKEKYGHDWVKVNFIGIDSTIKSLRDIAKYFGDEELINKTEQVIAEELEDIKEDMEMYREICEGKTAALFVGGSRAHHYQYALKDLGMETILAGYEFAHRDDYEGRDVLNSIKSDADSKNIEELTVEKDPDNYKVYLSKEKYEKLKSEIDLNDYDGLMKEMKDGSVIVDDLNHYETEEFLKLLKPDVFCSGIKDKYIAQKAGIFSKQLHSYDYSGPYATFRGAVNFGRDIAMGITTPAWSYVTPPWKTSPTIVGTVRED